MVGVAWCVGSAVREGEGGGERAHSVCSRVGVLHAARVRVWQAFAAGVGGWARGQASEACVVRAPVRGCQHASVARVLARRAGQVEHQPRTFPGCVPGVWKNLVTKPSTWNLPVVVAVRR